MSIRNLLSLSVFGGALACASTPTAGPAGPAVAQGGAAQSASAAGPGAPAGAPTKLATVEGITEYQLANGLRVLLYPDASKPTVTVNATYFVGSRHEGAGEAGMAHLLEHMLFKGTTLHKEPWKELEAHGAFFNGSTWVDRTNYFETMPASADNLTWALEFEADRMVNSRVSAEDLAKEFSVVRNEFELGENSPRNVLEERMYESAYIWHNYGRPTIGSKSDIEKVPIESLRAFYRKYYQPDNVMLVVAGKFDPAPTLALIQKDFGAIPRPARKLTPTYTVEPQQDGERQVILRRTGDVQVVGLAYHGVAGTHEDFVAEEALIELLNDQPSGRLYKALVEKGLAASVEGQAFPWAEPGMMQCFAQVRLDKSAETVKQKMIEIVEGLAKNKVTDEEVARFRVKALKRFDLAMSDSGRIGVEVSEWAAQGDWRLLFLHRDRVQALTTDRVRKVAAEYLKPSNRTVGLFLPTKTPDRAPLPAAADVVALVKDYKGAQAVAEGEQFAATIENIEQHTSRYTLPSGAKVALLPKKTRANAVHVSLAIHFAREADIKGKTTAAGMIGDMLIRGTRHHSYQQLKDEFDRLKAEVRFGSDSNQSTVRIKTIRENLPAVLALVSECLHEPTFPKDQFEILRKENIAQLEEQLSEPQALGFLALSRRLAPYPKDNVRYVPTIAEQIERTRAARLEDVVALHKSFWGASNAEIAIVGDFDEKAVKDALAKHFGSWKSRRPFERIVTPYKPVEAGDELILTPDKQMAVIGAAQSIEVRDDDPDYPALVLTNHVLGGAAKSRLFERLRQKDGLSYGAFSFVGADPFDRKGELFAGAICAPQNADKAMTAMMEELGKLVKEGIPSGELDEAKHSYKLQFENQISNNGYVAAMLSNEMYAKRTGEYWKNLNDKIQKLSSDDVGRVIKKHFQVDKLARVKAGDLQAKKAAKSDKAEK
ncbi:MAG TPA: pitrilysin family protein [Polyangia bacterium]|nr:pitrilysin family protein [Polyangia bacterium]